MLRKCAIYGTGGCARDILGPLVGQAQRAPADYKIVFVDDRPSLHGNQIHGHPITSYKDALSKEFAFCIAIADSKLRAEKAQQINADNGAFFSITSVNSIQYDNVTVGEGSMIGDFVTLTTDIEIGAHFHANNYSYVAHDCRIGDFVTFAPRVNCNGNVTIGDSAYVGTGAVIKQGITIGAGATVGMGAVVTKDVPDGATVVGNPANHIG